MKLFLLIIAIVLDITALLMYYVLGQNITDVLLVFVLSGQIYLQSKFI